MHPDIARAIADGQTEPMRHHPIRRSHSAAGWRVGRPLRNRFGWWLVELGLRWVQPALEPAAARR